MNSAENWLTEQQSAIEELKNDVKKWKDDAKKEARSWHDEMKQQISDYKQEIVEEIEGIKKEVRHGYKGTIRDSASATDILGSPVGESDQAETDDNTRRKRRSSSTGSN